MKLYLGLMNFHALYLTVSLGLLFATLQPMSASFAQTSDTQNETPLTSEANSSDNKTNEDENADDETSNVSSDINDIEVPEVSYDLTKLPFPTRRMHELILEATKSGDIEKLRALIGVGDSATQLSLGGFEGDAIDFLKQQSGDPDGYELLAILEEVLEAGFVHLDEGTDRELYVWPYFFAVPLDTLSAPQKVELFRIVTFGDYQDFKDFGGYIFYRVGISPTGRWQFFVAGD